MFYFKDEAEGNGIQLEKLETQNRLDQVVKQGNPYFMVELPSDVTFYAKIQGSKGFPINFGREVLATGPLLNMPDRADWKDCILNKEEEDTLVKQIRTDFEPYDFTEM